MDFSLSGLASGFDWKTFVDQMIEVQRAPITRIQTEQATNTNKASALSNLQERMTALQTASNALGGANLFTGRQVSSTTINSTWKPFVAAGTASGTYKVAVTQLATTARLEGATNRSAPLSATNDVSGTTIATLPAAVPITAGNFTVNGHKVTVTLTDSLEQVFAAIATATGGAVTAAYDSAADKITLTGSGEIVLGAANDSSNFLTSLKLANNGTASVTSSTELGVLTKSAPLAGARLNAAITAVDGSGNGAFAINGVSISYNVNTDTLTDIFARINNSGAGVTATYDGNNDRISLVNSVTGDTGIAVSEDAGGLMDALGLSTGSALVRGKNAIFTMNDGGTLTSSSNTLDAAAHGITGLSVTVDTESTQNLSVSGNTTAMKSAIQTFIDKYNDVQSFIAQATKISVTSGTVSTALLADNREIQEWASTLRSKVFSSVSGLSGTVKRLEDLGIDFTAGTSQLAIVNPNKLDTALANQAGDVAAFFQTGVTGLGKVVATYTTEINVRSTEQQERLTKTNTDLTRQIADIQRRLDQQKKILTASFIAMENAQSKLQTQSAALTKAFPTSTTSTK